MKIKNIPILFYAFLSYLFFILFIGFWPFAFRSVNNVGWLKNKNGIYLRTHGIVFGPLEDTKNEPVSFFGEEKSISIEIWLKPGTDVPNNDSYIFSIFDDQQPEIFSLAQVKSSLKISIPDTTRSKSNWRWLKNALFKAQKIFITISSDKNETIVYLNGKIADKFRNYSLVPERQSNSPWHVVIGNNPAGQKPWHGNVYGMAIYNQSLTPEKVYDHYQKWQSNEILSFAKEIGTVALYPMDEQTGDVIHNIAYDRYHLVIPKQFKGLKKNFLKLSRNSLNLSLKSFQDMSINIIGFIPFGYLFFRYIGSLRYRKIPMWQLVIMTISTGVFLSLIVEMSQTFLPTRYSSITDFIFNTIGAAIGASIAAALHIKAERISSANSNNT